MPSEKKAIKSTERVNQSREKYPFRDEFEEIRRLYRAGFMTKKDLKGFLLHFRKLKGIGSHPDFMSEVMKKNHRWSK